MRASDVEDISLSPNFINIPPPQSGFPHCKFPNDFDKRFEVTFDPSGIFLKCMEHAKFDREEVFGHARSTGQCYVPVKVQIWPL